MFPAMGGAKRPKIIAVVGRQAAGKSDLCRTLINSHATAVRGQLSNVLLVDLDSTHQEFNLDGQISTTTFDGPILGPPFIAHLYGNDATPYRSLRCHTMSPYALQQDEHHFVACARDLLSTCLQHASSRLSSPSSPPTIIVKFPELSQGFSSTVNTALLTVLQPSSVLVLARGRQILLSDISSVCPAGTLQELSPQDPFISTRTTDELREMSLLAQFHRIANLPDMPLVYRKPLCVSYSKANPDFLAIACYPDLPPPRKLSKLLTASIISVTLLDLDVASSLKTGQEARSGLPYIEHENGHQTPYFDPNKSQLIGVAFVRAVDEARQMLELLPISGELGRMPSNQLVLVHGYFETSKSLLTESSYWQEQLSDVSKPYEGFIDDSVSMLNRDVMTPYIDIVRDDQDTVEGEARWKSRKFNSGGSAS